MDGHLAPSSNWPLQGIPVQERERDSHRLDNWKCLHGCHRWATKKGTVLNDFNSASHFLFVNQVILVHLVRRVRICQATFYKQKAKHNNTLNMWHEILIARPEKKREKKRRHT